MNIITGMFSTVEQVRQAFTDLTNADVPSDQIGVIACDPTKREYLGEHLDRDYGEEYLPNEDTVYEPQVILRQLPHGFVRLLSQYRAPQADWYQQQLDAGNILMQVITDTGGEDVARILQHAGVIGEPATLGIAPTDHKATRHEDRNRPAA